VILIGLALASTGQRRRRRSPRDGDSALDREYGPRLGTVPVGPNAGVTFTPTPTTPAPVGPNAGVTFTPTPTTPAPVMPATSPTPVMPATSPTPVMPATSPTPVIPAQPVRGYGPREDVPAITSPASSSVDTAARRAAAEVLYTIATTTAAASRGPYRDRIREAQRILGITADGLIGSGTARAVYATIGRRIPGIAI